MSRRAIKVAIAAAVAAFAAACSDSPMQSGGVLTPSAQRAGAAEDQVVAGEVIVKVRSGADVGTVGRRNGAQFKARGYQGRFDVLATAPGNEGAAAGRLNPHP